MNTRDFLIKTVYDPASLMFEGGSSVKFSFEGMRGIKDGENYDIFENSNTLSKILKNSYGELCVERIDGKDLLKDFSRRPVASGGALYPNNIYILLPVKGGHIHIYQYNPVMDSLVFIGNKEYQDKDKVNEHITLICTKFYWRNWMKYRNFGYRLMSVDTGFLLGQLTAETNKYKLNPKFIIDTKQFKKIQNILNLDLNFESIEFVLEIKSIANILPSLHGARKISVNTTQNIENVPLKLFKKIEKEALSENYKTERSLQTNSSINTNYYNRMSPGGAQLISGKNVQYRKFEKLHKNIYELLQSFSSFLENKVQVFVGINKVDRIKPGGYLLTEEGGLTKVSDMNMNPIEYQRLITRGNFNLSEIPLFFAIAVSQDYLFSQNDLVQNFKEFQMKSGFVGELLTIAAYSSSFFAHPVLGYDALNLEKAFNINGDMTMTCFLPIGEFHATDRLRIFF